MEAERASTRVSQSSRAGWVGALHSQTHLECTKDWVARTAQRSPEKSMVDSCATVQLPQYMASCNCVGGSSCRTSTCLQHISRDGPYHALFQVTLAPFA